VSIDSKQKTGRHALDDEPDPGIFVRPPGEALFIVCRKAGHATAACPQDRRVVWLDAVQAPQLGQLRFLPFSNRAFEAGQLSVALREDGTVEKFEYKRTKAAGAEASAAVGDAATQIQAFLEKREARQASALTDARKEAIAQIQFEIDALTAQKALLKLQQPETTDALAAVKEETARIEAETALLEARLAQLKAEAALAEASAE
jgi:hypothetical protein